MTIKIKTHSQYDVCGIGSTLVDLTAEVDDRLIASLGLEKGRMTLVDDKKSAELLSAIASYKIEATPGGSAANTLADVAMLGGRAALMGMVGEDSYGDLYVKETESAGVASLISRCSSMTGHAITLITPDLERTFAVNLSAALNFEQKNVKNEVIASSSIIHLEGYLFELEHIRDACIAALKTAKQNGTLISIDLSDPSLVNRIKPVFDDIIGEYADIVFANEQEAEAFTGLKPLKALEFLSKRCGLAAVKLGAEGSLISDGNSLHEIQAFKTNLVNTNGAGDAYAAGMLAALAKGFDLGRAGRVGSFAASLAVANPGARITRKADISSIV